MNFKSIFWIQIDFKIDSNHRIDFRNPNFWFRKAYVLIQNGAWSGVPPCDIGTQGRAKGGAKGAPGRKPPSGLGLLALCCTRPPRLNRDLNDLDGRGSQKDTAFAVNVTFERAPHDATPRLNDLDGAGVQAPRGPFFPKKGTPGPPRGPFFQKKKKSNFKKIIKIELKSIFEFKSDFQISNLFQKSDFGFQIGFKNRIFEFKSNYSRAPGGGLDWIRIHPRPPPARAPLKE